MHANYGKYDGTNTLTLLKLMTQVITI